MSGLSSSSRALLKLYLSCRGMYFRHGSIISSFFNIFLTDIISIKNIIRPNIQYILFRIVMSIIDKIVVYGVPNPERLKLSEVLTNKINVTTLQLYSNPEQPTDDQFHKIDFEMWAYPDGIKIYDNHLHILNDSEPEFTFFENSDILVSETSSTKFPPEYLYSFVLTDYSLNRTYCTCLIWNERYFIKDDRNNNNNPEVVRTLRQNMGQNQKKMFFMPKQEYSLAVPKCKIQTMINNPLILDTNTILVYVPKAMIVCSKTPCLQFQRGLLKYYYKNVLKQPVGKQKNTIKIPKIFENNFNELIKNYGYPKAQIMFNEQKSETVKKIQLKLLKNSMKYIEKDRSSGLLSIETSKLKDFFISSLFTIPHNPKGSYIMTESGQRIGSRLKSETVFHLPKILDIFSQNFQNIQKSQTPLLPLPIPQFIQLWKCLLLQKQIIIFSNSQQQSILLCQLMLYLIQPIKWQNIYIPFLPFHLSHHIDAIGGYLIGMSRIHMDYMLDKFDMKNKVVVDLQHQTILEEGGKEVIELPENIQSYVEKQLKAIVNLYEEFQKPNRSLINYLITNQPKINKQKTKYLEIFVKSWLEIQKVFFNTLVVLFNNFIPFISQKQDGIIAVQTEEYLNILDDKLHRTFMKQISKTMVFIRLCEYHVEESEKCAWVQKNLGELFVYSHDILSHKFVVSDADLNKTKKQNSRSVKRAYAWTIKDLLLKQQKYSQYIQYLFEKNLKEITNIVVTIELYLTQQQQKYKILTSDDQFESLDVESVQVPLNFGKKSNKTSSGVIKQKDQDQYHNVYEQIRSEVIIKSKKYKKFGDKDQEQLYQELSKICSEHKIERYLIKYIKYTQLNYPQNLKKLNSKVNKKQNKKNGILTWLWDILNPPDSTRGKQESEVKSKLERKMTMKNIKTDAVLNLKYLFRINVPKGPQRKDSTEKLAGQKQLDLIRESEDNEKKVDKEQERNERNQRADKFIQAIKQKGQRPSQTQSDMV